MQRTAKKPFILMELLVALVLIGTMLTLLFKFFSNTLYMDRRIEHLRRETALKEHLQIRLLHLFTSVLPRSTLPDLNTPSIYSLGEVPSSFKIDRGQNQSPGLAIVFDNGIDPDPRFSGAVEGELSLDSGRNLFLSLYPLASSDKKTYRKELLLQQVETLKFEFLSKKSEDASKLRSSPSFEWIKVWSKDRQDIPPMVRVIVKREGEEIALAFSLPFADPITYTNRQT